MTEEEKQLIAIDISARLNYGVLFNLNGETYPLYKMYNDGSFSIGDEHSQRGGDNAKPYLRSFSTMTEEEALEMYSMLHEIIPNDKEKIKSVKINSEGITYDMENYKVFYSFNVIYSVDHFDWLNRKKFDYRGLIPKGLAIEAPKDMYKNDLL